jgi:diguanylate cyclase (GGDEF)-like protein
LAATLFDNQGGFFLHFVIDAESCVACLACVRDCPTDAIAVAGEAPLLQVVDELCIRCGQCYAVCAHDAVRVNGEVGRALAIASQGDGILILSPEMASHFYPATPEQVVNACYEAGFRTDTRGVIGDELVAAEYLKLWREEPWGTLIRSTDPVVVDAVRAQFPELIPYLAPVTTPPVAEARHLRVRFGPGLRIVHAGVNASEGSPDLDAAITFGDLEEVLGARGVNILAQPTWFSRVPEERRRHQSAAGGMPLELLEEFKQASARFRLVRGLDQLPAISRAVTVDRMDLGFVDILSYEGLLDHPLAGPKDQLFWRRALIASTEPPRALAPVLDRTLVASVGAIFQIQPERMEPDGETVAMILKEIGLGPNGRPWDCGACGFDTCQKFAEVAAAGRATLRQCLPYQERRAEDAQKAAAVDLLTGLSTYRVLRDRLSFEIERSRRNGETFAVLFLDLDRFKQVNDTYGHEAGNEILRAASAEIRNAVRASDVAARYGGDEFVVILTRTDLAGATRVAEALRAGIEGVGRRLGYESGLITVSCGIAEFDPKQPGEGDLLVTADRALYRAKAAGRNVVA